MPPLLHSIGSRRQRLSAPGIGAVKHRAASLNRDTNRDVEGVHASAAQVRMTHRLICLLATTIIQTATIAGASACLTTTPAPSATSATSASEPAPLPPPSPADAVEVAAVQVPGLDVTTLIAIAREQIDEKLPRRTLAPKWSTSLSGRVFAYEDLDDFMQGETRCRPATLVPGRNDAGGAVLHSKRDDDNDDGCTAFDELVIGADGTTTATDGFTRCARGEVATSGGGRSLRYVVVEATAARLLLATAVSTRVTHCERRAREVPCPGGGQTTCEDDAIVVDERDFNAHSFNGVVAAGVPPPHDCVAHCAPSACSEAVAVVAADDGVHYDPEQPVLALFRDRSACRAFAASRHALRAGDDG